MSPRSWSEELADRNDRRRSREREQMREDFMRRSRLVDAFFDKIRRELERAVEWIARRDR